MSEEGRALLTDTEREILTGEKDVKDNYRYKVQSLVRTRVRRRFGDDVEILREHFPEVYEMLEASTRGETLETGDDTEGAVIAPDEARELANILDELDRRMQDEWGYGHEQAQEWVERLREAVEDAG